MNYLDQPKRQGAATNRRMLKLNPFAVYCEMRSKDKTASDAIMSRKWKNAINDDPDLADAIAEYSRVSFEAQWQRDWKKPKRITFKPAEEIKKEREIIAKVVNKVKGMILMDMIMPNGKKLKDATFKECSAAGGWFKLLATKGMPGEKVGDKLTEKDLQNLK